MSTSFLRSPITMEPLTVPGTLASLKEIVNYVLTAAGAANLDERASYGLRLAVDEIATNIIVHGYEEAGYSGVLICHAQLNSQTLTITLEDMGTPYVPTEESTPNDLHKPIRQRRMGGLGVYLAIHSVDRFTYEREGNRNRNIFVVNRK